MHNITLRIKSTFPDLALWVRFPGLTSFAGCIAGVLVFSLISFGKFFLIPGSTVIIWAIIFCLLPMGILLRNNWLRCILFFIIAGLAYQARIHSYQNVTSEINSVSATSPVIITGRVISNPAPSRNYAFSFLVQTDSVYNADTGIKIKKTVICQGPQAPLYGTVISMQGKISAPQNSNTPFTFNDFDYLFSNDIYARVQFDRFIILSRNATGSTAINKYARNFTLDVISNLTNEDYRSVLRAAFIGESRFLSDDIKQTFRKSGIYHLLAISGLHAAMLTAAAFAFLFFIPINSNIKRIIVILLLWLYQMFIGWQPSLLRATIMASVMIGAFLFEKKQYTLQSLGIAGTIILLYSPQTLFSPGFQLSFAATAGILILYPRFAAFKPSFGSPFIRTAINHLYSSLSISLCGFLFTAPVLLYHFGSISLFGLIANIAAVTIMTSAMWLFFLSLLLHPLLPFLTLEISRVISLHFDALFFIAALSQHFNFSEIKLPIPPPLVIIVYIIILIGSATVKKIHLLKFLYTGLSIFGIVLLLTLSVQYFDTRIRVLQFNDSTSSWTSLRWPSGVVWIINYKLPPFKRSNQEQIINTWMRRYPWTSVKRVFNCETTTIKNSSKPIVFLQSSPQIIEILDSLKYDIYDHRCLIKRNYSCTIHHQSHPLQLHIISGKDTLYLQKPPSPSNEKSVVLTFFK